MVVVHNASVVYTTLVLARTPAEALAWHYAFGRRTAAKAGPWAAAASEAQSHACLGSWEDSASALAVHLRAACCKTADSRASSSSSSVHANLNLQ